MRRPGTTSMGSRAFEYARPALMGDEKPETGSRERQSRKIPNARHLEGKSRKTCLALVNYEMSNDIVTFKEDDEINKIGHLNETEKRKGSPLFKQITRWFSEFMRNSTIHGFKYLVDNEKLVIEKIWWICILLISSYTCAVLIKLTWQKWEEDPVFTAFRQKPVPLWDIPFPAVTVC
ncbi:hypothetical protein Zmor_013557 [Zophobas morio]|uniref:Uncharacterized protein n=1 Tax=Zophobas morio TaxID=2755281 RepID=A0AA38MER3_9CUCU|nr:hypothetical protein Zmor_013557 [Zophobas morio]